MVITFTDAQRRAIDLHGCNILVSAAAGSGKTAVLAERIVQMVCDAGQDIDRLLIVTFTNAAAAEMRERIGAGILARLSENPDSEHIQKQSALLHNAQITTIDSFCLFLLRNHFHKIGLDPAFRIADEGEIRLLEQEVLKELIEDSYASGEEVFHRCVEFFCPGGRESVLEKHILSLSRYAASFPFPARFLEARKKDYREEAAWEMCKEPYAVYLCGYLKRMTKGCAEKLERVRRLCEEADGPYMYGKMVEEETEQLGRLSSCETLQDFEQKLPGVSFGRLPSKKDDSVNMQKRKLAKQLRSQVKDTVQELAEGVFATPLTLAARQAGACAEPVETLLDLTLEFDRRMGVKKQEKKIVDFSDMEHFALDILLDVEGGEVRPSAVAKEYRQHFAEILTDEYQDSNLVQEYLLKAVSGEEDGRYNRFMVGDVKQSIYKFRLARPELFLEKYNTYEEEGDTCCRIDLSQNFRSRTQVVEAVNEVFGRIMSRETGGIAYDSRAMLYPGAVYPETEGCETELILVQKPEKEAELDAKRAEALCVARKIKELRERFCVTDKESGVLRPVKYSDMVILLRTNSGWDEVFKEVLEGEGIPVFVTSRTGYFAAAEVQELLQLMRVLDNPSQDIPLFGVMKSVFGGFTDEEIALIHSRKKDVCLYEALKGYVEEAGEESEGFHSEKDCKEEAGGGSLLGKVRSFLQMIAKYRRCTVYLPVRDLLVRLVDDFGYLDYVTALPAGSRRRANVEMLFTRASDFAKTSYFGLFHFIRYMEQLEEYDVDYGEAGLLDENADVVRIMSIHKSKGLEYPVAFVSGLSKRFNMRDTNQALILDMDLGLAVDYVDPERRIRNKTLRRQALSKKLQEESLSEELRVLYVAMTRAREKLILTGVIENAQEKWEQVKAEGRRCMGYLDFMEAGSFLDFLLPILPGTGILVSVEEDAQFKEGAVTEQMQMFYRQQKLMLADDSGDEEAVKKLIGRLNAVYPHMELAQLYTKTTVSELKIAAMADKDEAAYHAFEEKELVPYIPAFRREDEEVSGAVRGNAYHRVMELLDFEGILAEAFGWTVKEAEGEKQELPESFEDYKSRLHAKELSAAIESFLRGEVESGRLKKEYADAVRVQRIVKLLSSSLGYRMWAAQRKEKLYREQPFVLGIDAKRLKNTFPDSETVLIQGIIDAFFVEEDGLVLLDYKTDSVPVLEQLWNRYETQMDYYKEALCKLMGLPVKEQILYSFHLGEAGVRKC